MKKIDLDTPILRTPWRNTKSNLYYGKDIIPMWLADMDFPSSEEIIADLQTILEENSLVYSDIPNIAYEVILKRYSELYDLELEKEMIVFLPGLIPGVNFTVQTFKKMGFCESVTIAPVYPPLRYAPEQNGLRNIDVDVIPCGKSWEIDFDALENSLTPETRFLQFCNPHNPIGRVYCHKELEKLGELCLKHELYIMSDEVHMDLILDKTLEPTPFLSVMPEMASKTITISSASKSFNLAGCNCAYMIVPDTELRDRLLDAMRGLSIPPNVFGIQSMISAYTKGKPWLDQVVSYLRKNSTYLIDRVNQMPLLKITQPQEGTYLSWIDASAVKTKNRQAFFEKYGLGFSAGEPFGNKNFVRMNFACPFRTLEKATDRLEKAVCEFESKN